MQNQCPFLLAWHDTHGWWGHGHDNDGCLFSVQKAGNGVTVTAGKTHEGKL